MRIGFAFVLAIGGVIGAAMLAGCGGGGTQTNLPFPVLRFVNAAPDSNPIDYDFDTTKEASAVAYLSSSADITVNKIGDHDFSVIDSTTQVALDDVAFTTAKNNKYLGVTVGLENYGTENLKRLQLLQFQYDKNPPNGTQARLLIVHGLMYPVGFATPSIDFQGGNVATYDPNNPQFSAPNTAFANNPPATLLVDASVPLHFQARRAGTENVLADNATFTFDAGGIYLAVVSGVEGASGAQAPQVTYIKLN